MRKPNSLSNAANNSMREYKGEQYEKILSALRKIKVGGIYTEIATVAGMRPDQVGRRISEMEGLQMVFRTGQARSTPSKRKAAVIQLMAEYEKGEPKIKTESKPKTINPLFSDICQ